VGIYAPHSGDKGLLQGETFFGTQKGGKGRADPANWGSSGAQASRWAWACMGPHMPPTATPPTVASENRFGTTTARLNWKRSNSHFPEQWKKGEGGWVPGGKGGVLGRGGWRFRFRLGGKGVHGRGGFRGSGRFFFSRKGGARALGEYPGGGRPPCAPGAVNHTNLGKFPQRFNGCGNSGPNSWKTVDEKRGAPGGTWSLVYTGGFIRGHGGLGGGKGKGRGGEPSTRTQGRNDQKLDQTGNKPLGKTGTSIPRIEGGPESSYFSHRTKKTKNFSLLNQIHGAAEGSPAPIDVHQDFPRKAIRQQRPALCGFGTFFPPRCSILGVGFGRIGVVSWNLGKKP